MYFDKRGMVATALVLSILLSVSPISSHSQYSVTQTTDTFQPSAVVWSDDFENETLTLNQWLFLGYNNTIGGECVPNITVHNGMLYSTGPEINHMFHNSTTNTGTWSLDVFLEDGFRYIQIGFLAKYNFYPYIVAGPEGYIVYLFSNIDIIHFTLAYWVPDMAGSYPEDIDTFSFNKTSGWVHIDITRHPDGNLCVYLNRTLRLQALDTHWNTSEYFWLETEVDSDAIFDNVTVSDTVDIDKASPRWTEPLLDHTIQEGDDFRYSLHATDYSGLDTWWLNDTAHFAVDDAGVVTNVTSLQAGNYSVEVFVNDTLGNVLSGIFTLRVIGTSTSTTDGTALQMMTIIALGVSIGSLGVMAVMAVLIVQYRRRTSLT